MDATYEWWVRVLFFLGGVVIGSMMAGLASVLRLRRQKRRYLEMFDDEPEKEVECFDPQRCSNCGKDVDEAPHRITGGHADPDEWFCSSYCYDEHGELGCPFETGDRYRDGPPPIEPEKTIDSLTEADLLEILRLAKMAPLSEASEEGCRRFQELLDATIPTADDYNQRLCLGPEEDTHTFKSAADVQAFHDHMEEGTAEQFGNFRQANRAEPEKGDPS